jgi:hypothetical protein
LFLLAIGEKLNGSETGSLKSGSPGLDPDKKSYGTGKPDFAFKPVGRRTSSTFEFLLLYNRATLLPQTVSSRPTVYPPVGAISVVSNLEHIKQDPGEEDPLLIAQPDSPAGQIKVEPMDEVSLPPPVCSQQQSGRGPSLGESVDIVAICGVAKPASKLSAVAVMETGEPPPPVLRQLKQQAGAKLAGKLFHLPFKKRRRDPESSIEPRKLVAGMKPLLRRSFLK